MPGHREALASVLCLVFGAALCFVLEPFAVLLGISALSRLPAEERSGYRTMALIGIWGGVTLTLLPLMLVFILFLRGGLEP